MDLMQFLARVLNPNPGVVNQMTGASTGLGPEQLARYHQQSGMGSAPQAAPSMSFAADHAMTPQQPSPAPQQAQAAPAPSGSGIGGFLGGLFGNPETRQKNETVKWLTGQGMDEGTATMMASHKPSLQAFLLERAQGSKPEYDFINGRDGSIFRADKKSGSLAQVYGGKADQPTDVQEYEYAKGQGYAGTFQQFQIEQKRAGASQVNIDQKAEGAFDKKLAENQATIFTDMATEGLNAKADLAVLGELDGLLGQSGGTLTGISGALAKYGIGGEGMSDIQAAQALINKLVPTQRQPGSGTMSDRDVELFTRSLPSLWNAPGGNQKILSVMRGLAQYRQTQGEIATAVMNGQMSRQEAAKALQSIPNPLADFGGTGGTTQGKVPAVGESRYGYRFKGGDPSEPSNWEKAQ